MFGKLRMAGMALAVMVVAAAGELRAQTPEAEALGTQIAHVIFEAVDFDEVMVKAVQENSIGTGGMESRPEWAGYLRDAMAEEVAHDLPAFERLFGRELARSLSVEELKAGVVITGDAMFQAVLVAGARDQPTPDGNPGKAAVRAMETAAGQGFLARLEGLEKLFDALEGEFLAEIMPGTLRRFADKIDTGEQARRATTSRP